jgi:hypothetical protein
LFFSALLAASAVTQEKDKRTLVLLLLTNLNNSELVLGKLLAPGSTQVTPAQASTLSKDEVKAVVEQAQQQQPNVADGLANFYAQHSGLIKTLGGAALAVALASMKNDLSKRR